MIGEPLTSESLDDSSFITLERTMCFGWCPEYRITVHGSGRIDYVGSHYVCEVGAHGAQISAEEASHLLRAAMAAGFFAMSDEVEADWTDAPSASISISHDGKRHTVRHYHGDQDAPRLLNWIEDRVDEVAGTSRWLGAHTRQGRVCPSPPGRRIVAGFDGPEAN